MKLRAIIPVYLDWLKAIGRSYYTILGAKYGLNDFIRFVESEMTEPDQKPLIEDLTKEMLYEYQQELSFKLTSTGKPLSLRTQGQLLGVVKSFTKYLKTHDYLIQDPGEALKLPKKPKRLPKVILNDDEVRKLVEAPDLRTSNGYRNRVVIEILYDTAIRRSELSHLKVHNIDLDYGYIHVLGKGDKERVVPVSKRVCRLIDSYIKMIRPDFLPNTVKPDDGYLILNRWGRPMAPIGIWAIVKRCAALAGLQKTVSTHTFRHTCATHMLRNGAPIRHLQEMLGHESLESTQLYTRVTINDLKDIHAKYHPLDKFDE